MRFGIKVWDHAHLTDGTQRQKKSKKHYIDAKYILEVFCESEYNYATLDSQTWERDL